MKELSSPLHMLYISLFSTDAQQLLVSDEVLPQQRDQEDLHQLPHIKEEEEEEAWSDQEDEQRPGPQEADLTEFTFSPEPVKSEDDNDDEEKPQCSQLRRTAEKRGSGCLKADEEDCGGPEPARNFDPDTILKRRRRSCLNLRQMAGRTGRRRPEDLRQVYTVRFPSVVRNVVLEARHFPPLNELPPSAAGGVCGRTMETKRERNRLDSLRIPRHVHKKYASAAPFVRKYFSGK